MPPAPSVRRHKYNNNNTKKKNDIDNNKNCFFMALFHSPVYTPEPRGSNVDKMSCWRTKVPDDDRNHANSGFQVRLQSLQYNMAPPPTCYQYNWYCVVMKLWKIPIENMTDFTILVQPPPPPPPTHTWLEYWNKAILEWLLFIDILIWWHKPYPGVPSKNPPFCSIFYFIFQGCICV